MKVYLDDLRTPPNGWILVKTAKAAINLLKTNKVTDISLDHDLGDDKNFGTGYDVIVWIEKQTYTNKKFNIPNIKIHTANVSARQKMELALKSILKYNIKENKLLLKNIINENPDHAETGKQTLNWSSFYAIPFGYYNNKIRVGDTSDSHTYIQDMYDDTTITRNRDLFDFPGRIWFKPKVISFWVYPPKNKIVGIFNDLKKEIKKMLEINIGSITQYKIDLSDDTLVPLSKFLKLAGKQKRTKKQLQLKHMMSPVAKGSEDVPDGVGSNKFPAGMSYSQYSQLIRTSENKMKKIKLIQFIKEEWNNSIFIKGKNLKRIGWIVINRRKNDGRPLYTLEDSDPKDWGATYRMGSARYSESSPLFYTVPIKIEGPRKFRMLNENEKWSRPYAYDEIEIKK